MTVKELIAILQAKPQDLQVVYRCHSEYCLLEVDDIDVQSLCVPRQVSNDFTICFVRYWNCFNLGLFNFNEEMK